MTQVEEYPKESMDWKRLPKSAKITSHRWGFTAKMPISGKRVCVTWGSHESSLAYGNMKKRGFNYYEENETL